MRIMGRMNVTTDDRGRIPPPTDPAEAAAWHRDQALLEADPRTRGTSPRPRWEVERVLGRPLRPGRRP